MHVGRIYRTRTAIIMVEFSKSAMAHMTFDILTFPHGAPIQETEIREAEIALGHAVPAELLAVYRVANGFRGPTNAAFLYPLLTPQAFNDQTAVALTLALREEGIQPSFWDRAIMFGDPGMMPCWGIEVDSARLFEWWPEDGEEIAYLDRSILQLWCEKKAWYDEITNQTNPV